ncbi:PREDICTED: uncharacterized protein LOC105462662 [Wasmannia auropunctata]|uniref:uncharacterized protein LOC105462662 n=1 Tax=Wasmannia auropunctata TaxID=64793 RepID=UPI0005F092B7|nr:PREDICTED: uncharacterized protein LOC105462662 [Wasmannia auropunctata]
MDEIQAKIGTWMELIQSEKLQDVSEDIQMSICMRPDSKLNGKIFKLLLELCRTADKCDEQSCETGKGIAKLAKLLCSLLIEIPDDRNFVKALFKIVQCLMSFNLYEDAADICCYLEPGNLYIPKDDTMILLTKVLSLWRVLVNDIYVTLTNESVNMENYSQLKSVMRHEMKMIQLAYRNYMKHLIAAISVNLDRIALIDKDKKYYDDFCKYILEYLSEVQLHLDKDEKYVIYCHILRIVCHVICRTINTTDIACTVKTLEQLASYFETVLKEDEECYQCFQQFQNFCKALLVPIKNLVSDGAKSIQNVIYCNLDIVQTYGHTECLKLNALSIAEVIEPLFTYWENCAETDKHMFQHLLDTGILPKLLNLFIHVNADEFYNKQVSIKCKWCGGKLCTVKKDFYNVTVMKSRGISLVCKFPAKTLPAEVCTLARKILEQNVASIVRELKESECKRWVQTWNAYCSSIYNVGILCEHIYDESVRLFSFLCTCIFQLEGVESKHLEDSKNLQKIISFALHRLSVVHYNNKMYRKAMTACALNILLTCKQSDTKAFHMWITIKKVAEEIANLTVLECLRNDKDEMKSELGFSLDTSKYDLPELYLREARNLLEGQITFTNGVEAVLDNLRKLQPSNQYAHVVQLLGYYFLGFKYDSSILKYYEQAICDLKLNKSNSVAVLCLEASLSLFTFVEELHIMNKQTHMEMENTKFALCAPKLRELAETKSPNVVPAYTMINVKRDTNLMLCLQKSLKKWKQLFKCYFKEMVKNWEPKLILRMLITAGEYARLYRYEDCEVEIWTLAYKLASEMNDHATIYITSRCISLRQVNYDWITTAKKHIIEQRNSTDENVIDTIATFWISLADLYFECGKYDDAKQLLTEARSFSKISFVANKSLYLLSLDVLIRNSHFYKDNMQHEDYGSYIVESLFAMRSLNVHLLTKTWTDQASYLFSYDVLFTMAVNLSIRVNSMLSFRGISPDLVRILKSAQSINAMLRTAELLKLLCYIDLSRLQLDDCEVKLQGLEHMLNIETFQLSMESKPVETPQVHLAVTPTKLVDPVRDASEYGASPVLGKKVFDLPKFTSHTNCDCYKCGNVSYQYLVFATTYIRAQLYALQKHTLAALDHFHGAFEIRRRLFEEEKSVLPENWPRDEIGVKRFSWQTRFYITDYIMLLIDFSYFMKTSVTSRQEDAFDIANLAVNMCYKYKLEGHPVYIMAKELTLDNEFQSILESSDGLKFMVPQPHDIDIGVHAKVPIDPKVCVTPCAQNRASKPLSVRRRKSPRVLKIPKINLIWSDDEDDNSASPPPPPRPSSVTYTNKKSKSRTNLVKRKILEEDLVDDVASLSIEDSKETKSESLNENENSMQEKSTRDIMIKVTSLVPDISKNLMNLVDKSDLPATMENVEKLIENIESLKIKSNTRRKNVRDTKLLTVADFNRNINRAVELLKDMTINEKTNEKIDSSTPTKSEKVDKLADQKIPETPNERKFFKTRRLKESLEKASTPLTNKHKTARSKSPRLLINNEDSTRTIRSSLRRSKKE